MYPAEMQYLVCHRCWQHSGMKPKKKPRHRIDTMIDAHVWMRRAARRDGEWPMPERTPAPPPPRRPAPVTKWSWVRADLDCVQHPGIADVRILAFCKRDSPPNLYYFLYRTCDK